MHCLSAFVLFMFRAQSVWFIEAQPCTSFPLCTSRGRTPEGTLSPFNRYSFIKRLLDIMRALVEFRINSCLKCLIFRHF